MDRIGDKYSVENHAEWREKVQDYVDAGDRGEEPVYVGREDLFDKVARMAGKVARMARSAVRGQTDSRTIVVSGAPGAGKTAFVRELTRRWNDGSRPGIAVWLRPGAMNAIRLYRELSDILAVPVADRADHYGTKELGGNAGLVKGKVSETDVTVSPGDIDASARATRCRGP